MIKIILLVLFVYCSGIEILISFPKFTILILVILIGRNFIKKSRPKKITRKMYNLMSDYEQEMYDYNNTKII